jgi:hypothetical protein
LSKYPIGGTSKEAVRGEENQFLVINPFPDLS